MLLIIIVALIATIVIDRRRSLKLLDLAAQERKLAEREHQLAQLRILMQRDRARSERASLRVQVKHLEADRDQLRGKILPK